ncbi:hypothetical protein N7471_013308 [Penicillium samsonianum]|uniref:uncharacterized protein n=1 Tax=Penicillium samsonianum TaxID=1882272 RepID=UPI002546AD9D|nr:uncharacterized protein N7471_013308 [Penicillium samsonianum]KAJ6118688.1 hypothetical protein N7471_013308 [Penicillium samsonianum]
MEKKTSPPRTGLKTFPSANAPADEVRTYITQLLVNKYNVSVDDAEKHASKWEIGQFSRLTPASQETIQRIFGDNVGLCIYSAIQEDLSELLDARPLAIISSYAASASALALASVVLLLILPELGLQAKQDRITWAVSPVWWFLSAASWAFYAIKHPLNPVRAVLSFIGGFVVVLVGINMFLFPWEEMMRQI